MAAIAMGWDVLQKAVWSVTIILALQLPSVSVLAFLHVFPFVFNSIIKGFALYHTVSSSQALRFSVWWGKGKEMKLKIPSLTFLPKEWIDTEGNVQAAPRVHQFRLGVGI